MDFKRSNTSCILFVTSVTFPLSGTRADLASKMKRVDVRNDFGLLPVVIEEENLVVLGVPHLNTELEMSIKK